MYGKKKTPIKKSGKVNRIKRKFLQYNFTVDTVYKSITMSMLIQGTYLNSLFKEVELMTSQREYIEKFISKEESSIELLMTLLLHPKYLNVVPTNIIGDLNLKLIKAQKEKIKIKEELQYEKYAHEYKEENEVNEDIDKMDQIELDCKLYQDGNLSKEESLNDNYKPKKKFRMISQNKFIIDLFNLGVMDDSIEDSIEEMEELILSIDNMEKSKNPNIGKGEKKVNLLDNNNKNGKKSLLKKVGEKKDKENELKKITKEDSKRESIHAIDKSVTIVAHKHKNSINSKINKRKGNNHHKFMSIDEFIYNRKKKVHEISQKEHLLYKEVLYLYKEKEEHIENTLREREKEKMKVKLPYLKDEGIRHNSGIAHVKNYQMLSNKITTGKKLKFKINVSKNEINISKANKLSRTSTFYIQTIHDDYFRDKMSNKILINRINILGMDPNLVHESEVYKKVKL